MSNARNIGDSAPVINFLDNVTSDVQTQLNTLDTAIGNVRVTSGSLTKTVAADEVATITLSGNVLAPVVTATKEVEQSGVTNNDWDAAAASYTLENSATATTLTPSAVGDGTFTLGSGSFTSDDVGKTISGNGGVAVLTSASGDYKVSTNFTNTNAIASGDWTMYALVYDSTADVLKPSQYIQGYQVTSAAYDSNTVNISAKSSSGEGLYVKADGSKFYVIDSTYDKVFEYDMSTPDDLTTASFVGEVSVASEEINPKGVFFKPDGLSMYIIGMVNPTTSLQDIRQYTLSTAWDVSTATYSSKYIYVGGSDNEPQDLWISSDGTLVFWIGTQSKGGTTGRLYKWTMSTAWDISTAVATQSINIDGYETSPRGIALAADGKSFYTIGTQYDAITGWYLSTAFDLSTAGAGTAAGYLSTSAQDGEPRALAFNGDGSKLFTSGTSNTSIFRYSTGSSTVATGYQPAIGSTIDSTYWTDLNSMTATNAVGDGNVFYALSADAKTSWNILDNSSGVRKIVKNNGGTYQVNTNSTYGSETWADAATNTEVAALREAMTSASSASNAFDISTATYSSTFSVASQDTDPTGLAFNSDGSKMYVVGNSANAIHEYALSTAFDVSTASFSHSFSTTAHTTSPSGITFKPDGTIMYVSEAYNSAILQYALSTAFNVSTATYTQTYNVSTQEADVRGVAFNSDGTKMFIIGIGGDDVNEYALSTAYDISTATYTQNFSVAAQDANPEDLVFNSDGTKMWIVGGAQVVNAYTLTTGFDVSTASYASVNFAVFAQDTSPMGLVFNSDGTKLFVVGLQNDSVYEYTVGSTDYTNQMTSTELNAINDASQITLGTALDLATIIYYASGSTTPTYSGTAINYDANVLNQGAILGTDYTYDAPAQNKVRVTSVNAANLKIRVV